MGLLNFPDELLLLVAENLHDARDLSSFLKTNIRLAFALSPLLCKLAAAPEYATTALYYAAANGDADMVQSILEKGATVELAGYKNANLDGEKTGDDEEKCSKDMVDFVVKKGADLVLDSNGSGEFRAINWAAWTGNVAMTKFLVSRGADITFVPTACDESLLRDAIQGGNLEIVEFLLDSGLSMEITDPFGGTGLHVAAQKGQLSIAQLLMDRGTDISSLNNDGETALHCAVVAGKVEMVELLLCNRADPNIEAKFGDDTLPLHIAAGNKGHDIAHLLISHGADVDAVNSDGRTALSFAVSAEDEMMVELLIDEAANIGLGDDHGITPLHIACEKPEVSMVELLLNNGADINAQDHDLWTPLHWAGQHINIINLLVARGAEVMLKDEFGRTPLDLAGDNEKICAILEDAARAASVNV